MKKLFISSLIISSYLYPNPKVTLKSNSSLIYHTLPSSVDNFSDIFSKGVFYGRLRFNSSAFKWDDELHKGTKWLRKDNAIGAIGGSLTYHSAYMYGVGFGVGGYVSKAKGSLDNSLAYLYKGGKDLINRYDMLHHGDSDMSVIAQSYIEYRYSKGYMQYGRVLFDSFLTKSNDTKMIPNAFEGVTYHSSDISDTHIKLAYLTKQKLKDHTKFHHLLAWKPRTDDDKYAPYTQNDDSAMHRGLTLEKLQQKGIDDRLIVCEVDNHSIDKLDVKVNYTSVPKLLSSAMIQLDYKLSYKDVTIKPAVRYMYQFDDQAGQIGGANLKGITQGYKTPNSLDAYLVATRLDIGYKFYKFRLGYSYVANKGDIVAPWRGFPTSGFTRAMSQYNWYANTKAYMLQCNIDMQKAHLFTGTKATFKYVIQDFDDKKLGVPSDNQLITLDIFKKFENDIYMKLRFAHSFGKSVANKLENSYSEARMEFNYLF